MKKQIVFFIHGYESSSNTDRFQSIQFKKECLDLDYDLGISKVLKRVENRLKQLINKFDVYLIGHSLGAYLANELSYKYNLNALLITPVLYQVMPHNVKKNIFDKEFNLNISNSKVNVMVEIDDEIIKCEEIKEIAKNMPKNYVFKYYEKGNHRVNRKNEINRFIDENFNFIG